MTAMNRLHLILVAVLDSAKGGGLSQEHAEAVFDALSDYLNGIPSDCISQFEENVRRILDADLPPENAPVTLKAPFVLSPDFLPSFGYRRGRRVIALYWEPCGDEACYDDGVHSACGTCDGWKYLDLVRRPDVRRWLDENGIHLGGSDESARHRLVVDAQTGEVHAAPCEEAKRLVRLQRLPIEGDH